jgi:hypothetical protein
MISQNLNKSNAKKTTFFISYDVMLKYICVKKYTLYHIKKCKHIQKIIEFLKNLYEICSIY